MTPEALFAGHADGPGLVAAAGDAPCDLPGLFAREAGRIDAALADRGALLFRGFRIAGAAGFDESLRALGATPFGYVGGDSPRRAIGGDVFTSTEHPPSETISLHHEMSYLPRWPTRLAFFAERAPAANGQTALAMTRAVTRAIPAPVAARFAERGLRYIRNFFAGLPLGRSWQQTFGTDDRDAAERIARDQGSSCRWAADGSLRVETPRDAFLPAPGDGAPLWFNQAEQWHPSALAPAARALFEAMLGSGRLPHDCTHGDGTPIDPGDLAAVRAALAGAKWLFDWADGDLLLLDNRLVMHGREPFAGPRRILAYLAA